MSSEKSAATQASLQNEDQKDRLSNNDLSNRRDCLVVMQAAPLIWEDCNGTRHPIPPPDFETEKNDLIEAVEEARDDGYGDIDLVFEEATTTRLGGLLAKGRSPVLHFSCHGHPDYLAIENKGAMQQLGVEELKEFVAAGNGRLKVVFISACYSRRAGDAFVAAGVGHVVCCKTGESLRDSAAKVFSQSFYTALASGNHLEASFKLACRAVLVAPSVVDPRVEMDKFLLLPEKPEGDSYHDVPVFYTQPIRHTAVDRKANDGPNSNIPPPPQLFLGREVSMYNILDELATARLVGISGLGKSSCTKATLNYICERSRTFAFKKYFWVPPLRKSHDDISKQFCELFEIWKSSETHHDDLKECRQFNECFRRLVTQLSEMRVLIAIDARTLNSDSGTKKLDLFLTELFLETRHVKVIVICPAGQNTSFSTSCLTGDVSLPPLSMRSSVLMLGNFCKFVQQRLYPALCSSDQLAELLVPDKQADATVTNKSMSQRCSQIFLLVGEGNPGKIRVAAVRMTEKKYNELIRLGISQLEEETLPRLSKKLRRSLTTDNAEELKDHIEKLQRLLSQLPSLAELEQQHAQLASAIRERENQFDVPPNVQVLDERSSLSSSDVGELLGVDFYGAYMDERDEWNDVIIKRKEHIEMQLKKLERFGTLTAGKPQISVQSIQRNGMERAVVRLECEFDIRKDLETKEFIRVKQICQSIAGFLKDAGASESELDSIMIGAAWKGSLYLLLEAPTSIFYLLFKELSRGAKRLTIQEKLVVEGSKSKAPRGRFPALVSDLKSTRFETVNLVAIAPAFLVRIPLPLIEEFHKCVVSRQRQSDNLDAVSWNEQGVILLMPTSEASLAKLVLGGFQIWSQLNDDEWSCMPSIEPSGWQQSANRPVHTHGTPNNMQDRTGLVDDSGHFPGDVAVSEAQSFDSVPGAVDVSEAQSFVPYAVPLVDEMSYSGWPPPQALAVGVDEMVFAARVDEMSSSGWPSRHRRVGIVVVLVLIVVVAVVVAAMFVRGGGGDVPSPTAAPTSYPSYSSTPSLAPS